MKVKFQNEIYEISYILNSLDKKIWIKDTVIDMGSVVYNQMGRITDSIHEYQFMKVRNQNLFIFYRTTNKKCGAFEITQPNDPYKTLHELMLDIFKGSLIS